MRRLVISMLLGFIIFPSVLLAQLSQTVLNKPELIVILSSYSYEKEWSTSVAKELRNRLEAERPGARVTISYTGIETHSSFLAARFAMQGAFAIGLFNKKVTSPDALVLIGDESWMLYRIMDYGNSWGEVPIVLCGVHKEILKDYRDFFLDQKLEDSAFIPLRSSLSSLNATAITEPDNISQTFQLANSLVPDFRHLYYVSDGSYTDSYKGKKLAAESRRRKISFCELTSNLYAVDSINEILYKAPLNSVIVTHGASVSADVKIPILALRDMDYQPKIPAGGFFAPISAYVNQASEAVLQILNTGRVDSSLYSEAIDTAYYMNQTALMNLELRSKIKNIPHVVSRNIPPPFILRNIREISAFLFILVFFVFIGLRIFYSRRFGRSLNALFNKYKALYGEYQTVYENMPVGLMLFDIHGKLLKQNIVAEEFFKLFAQCYGDFLLFSSALLDEKMHELLFRNEKVNKMLYIQESCYRIQCCLIPDEDSGANHILLIVIDNTGIEKERKAKKQISNVLNFAMNKAVIGVAEYNLVDGLGFATDAWYDILDIGDEFSDFSQAHLHLLPEDRIKVLQYLEQVRCGLSHRFLESLTMQNRIGEIHHVRYLIQPLEYSKDKKHIIVAELILNIDQEKIREQDLETAMKKAEEADRFKNAFVANMRNDIRIPLKEIISCSRELAITEDVNYRTELNSRIEASNEQILKLMSDIIEVSKAELNV